MHIKKETFSFEYFKKMLRMAYREVGSSTNISYKEVEHIFEYYFDAYRNEFKRPHKRMRLETLKDIIMKLDYCGCSWDHDNIVDLEADMYEELVDLHFKTKYRNCDYNMSHFMSGGIRANRYYEMM